MNSYPMHQSYLVAGTALFVVIIATLALLQRRPIMGAFSAALRPFVSSWRFFDQVTDLPTLQARTVLKDGGMSAWRSVIVPPRVYSWSLLFHPHGNVFHAQQTLVQQALLDLVDPERSADSVEESGSFQLLRHLSESVTSEPDRRAGLQFRVGYAREVAFEELLVSGVLR